MKKAANPDPADREKHSIDCALLRHARRRIQQRDGMCEGDAWWRDGCGRNPQQRNATYERDAAHSNATHWRDALKCFAAGRSAVRPPARTSLFLPPSSSATADEQPQAPQRRTLVRRANVRHTNVRRANMHRVAVARANMRRITAGHGHLQTISVCFAACTLWSWIALSARAEDKPNVPGRQDSASPAEKSKAGDDKSGQDTKKPTDPISPDRPGIADSSQVIGPKRLQVEIGVGEQFLGGGANTARVLTVPTLLRFGLDTRYEFRIETNGYSDLSSTDPLNGTQHSQGGSPLSFGFKRQFSAGDDARHASVGAIFRLFPGSGGGAFRVNHATGDLRLAADWKFNKKFSLNPNIGFGTGEDSNGVLYANFQLATTLTWLTNDRLNFFVDYGYQSLEEAGGSDSLIYDAGVTYLINNNVQLDASVGTGARGRTSPHPFWSAGISVRF